MSRKVVIAAVLLVAAAAMGIAQVAQTPILGSTIPQFVDPLPKLRTIVAKDTQIVLSMNEFQAPVLSKGTFAAGVQPMTWVWGYQQPGQPVTSYIGPVIVAKRGAPTEIKFINNLGIIDPTGLTGSKVLSVTQSIDQTMHWADPLNNQMNMAAHSIVPGQPPQIPWNQLYTGPVVAVPHLHGGEVPPVMDGGPNQWFSSDGKLHGNGFYTKDGSLSNYSIFRYPNTQEAAPIWFHDHTLGATRINVYAGLAGAYLITDPEHDPKNLPPLVPLVLQDRMFDTNGQLFFPAGIPYNLNPEHPYWVPEFVGDTIVVNGKTWPYVEVEPKRYTFLFLNGSNARTYEMYLTNADGTSTIPMWQIATDGGYLDFPSKIDPAAATNNHLMMMPGERAEVIIDFAKLPPGTNIILSNAAACPYPTGTPVDPATTGKIVQFRVIKPATTTADASYNPASNWPLRAKLMTRLVNTAAGTLATGVAVNKTRQLTLNEIASPPVTVGTVAYPGGPREILVNNTDWEGTQPGATPGAPRQVRPDFIKNTLNGITAYISENPKEGDTELWEIVNLTMDAHPIHMHLAQFQLLNRQDIDLASYLLTYVAAFPGGVFAPDYGPPLDYNTGNTRALGGNPDVTPYLRGLVQPPRPWEVGWKDTVMVQPNQVTRFVVRWCPTDVKVNADAEARTYPFDPTKGPIAGQVYGYVWHCHIIDHEDNEMMRPYALVPRAASLRSCVYGRDY